MFCVGGTVEQLKLFFLNLTNFHSLLTGLVPHTTRKTHSDLITSSHHTLTLYFTFININFHTFLGSSHAVLLFFLFTLDADFLLFFFLNTSCSFQNWLKAISFPFTENFSYFLLFLLSLCSAIYVYGKTASAPTITHRSLPSLCTWCIQKKASKSLSLLTRLNLSIKFITFSFALGMGEDEEDNLIEAQLSPQLSSLLFLQQQLSVYDNGTEKQLAISILVYLTIHVFTLTGWKNCE